MHADGEDETLGGAGARSDDREGGSEARRASKKRETQGPDELAEFAKGAQRLRREIVRENGPGVEPGVEAKESRGAPRLGCRGTESDGPPAEPYLQEY